MVPPKETREHDLPPINDPGVMRESPGHLGPSIGTGLTGIRQLGGRDHSCRGYRFEHDPRGRVPPPTLAWDGVSASTSASLARAPQNAHGVRCSVARSDHRDTDTAVERDQREDIRQIAAVPIHVRQTRHGRVHAYHRERQYCQGMAASRPEADYGQSI